MRTVVITGSAKGFGFEMMRVFRRNNFNCVLCDVDEDNLEKSCRILNKMNYSGKVISYKMDVTDVTSIKDVVDKVINKFGVIDIWINNAGVSQPDKYVWELGKESIDVLIDVDLKGVINCTSVISDVMIKQGFGGIYNVEGHGSNDALIPKLTLYGTAKRAVTYFTESFAKEVLGKNICVGKITPGIMITNFLNQSGDGGKLTIDDKTKKIYNILGDYPETIAEYIVPKIIRNEKNNVKFVWLTSFRAFGRFIKSPFSKRDLFEN